MRVPFRASHNPSRSRLYVAKAVVAGAFVSRAAEILDDLRGVGLLPGEAGAAGGEAEPVPGERRGRLPLGRG